MKQIALCRTDLLRCKHGIDSRDTGEVPVPLFHTHYGAYKMHMYHFAHFDNKNNQNIPYNHYLEYLSKIYSIPEYQEPPVNHSPHHYEKYGDLNIISRHKAIKTAILTLYYAIWVADVKNCVRFQAKSPIIVKQM